MIILGKNTDDKGTQLETLTTVLLRHLGYRNIACNVLGAGSEELDVTADVEMTLPGAAFASKIICECKAYKNPVALPEWLKFLGKLYNAEATGGGQRVLGCFVALSGVNGACQGHYTELKKHRPEVSLLAGDALLEETRKVLPFATLEQLSNRVDALTPRRTRLKEVAYYDRQVYWLVAFDHDAYTVLDANGSPLDPADAEPLRQMIDQSLSLGDFVDLNEEERARRRTEIAMKLVMTSLIRVGGVAPRGSVNCTEQGYSAQEVHDATEELIGLGVLKHAPDTDRLAIVTTDAGGQPAKLGAFFRLLLRNSIPIDALGCEWYDQHIDEWLVEEVREVQGGLPLTIDQVEQALRLMKLSPSALYAALAPIELIVNHRSQLVPTAEIDACDVDIFFQILHRKLRMDFQSRALAEYFHERRGVVELDVASSIRLKSHTKVEIQDQTRVRIRIGQLDPGMVGGRTVFVHMQALNAAPEPWEESRPAAPDPASDGAGSRVEAPPDTPPVDSR